MSDKEKIKEATKMICDYVAEHPEAIMKQMERKFMETAIFIAESERERRKRFNHELLTDLRKGTKI